ncbi:MAG: lipase maturation factor family protein [Phycisphaerae bacterium]|nr:lipase maturation factor family protein [Phycisphaerae bacterium]
MTADLPIRLDYSVGRRDMGWIPRTILPQPSVFTRTVFLRSLGAVYCIAFASASHQVDGLIGSQGILPIAPFLKAVGDAYSFRDRWEVLPTVFWINASDRSIHIVCFSGIGLSVLLMIGLLPTLVTALLWVLYLSIVTSGQVFFGYQWDALLLETGFLAILYSPLQMMLWRRPSIPPNALIVLLLRLLLLRVMISSGIGKLSSDDPNWQHFRALDFHYFTQPIPTWTAWYMQQLPPWFQTISVGFTFFAEIIAPLMIFGPRICRLIAFWTMNVLQLLIMVTGNFGFFNILTIALSIPLLDDRDWPVRWRQSFLPIYQRPRFPWVRWLMAPVAAVLGVLGAMKLVEGSYRPFDAPRPLSDVQTAIAPFASVNSYGLFRVMTTTRNEIVVEGSDDGETWQAYEFRWKPGDVNRRPRFCTPDMPRLDWQMWFASLGDVRSNPWFVNFLVQLLRGQKPVGALLEHNPFPDSPPGYVRALSYSYRFTTRDERRTSGAWWHRDLIGVYCPAISLRDIQ